jgi:hypothetical protein
MTFDEIYNMAIDKGIMDQELKVKDAAYSCICGIIEDVGLDELLENSECKEDSVISFCEKTEALFDERGNLVSLKLPDWIENIIWRRRQDEYLKEDILTIAEDIGVSVDTAYMQKVIEKYHKIEDSNVPYNDTVEIAILSVLKEEK